MIKGNIYIKEGILLLLTLSCLLLSPACRKTKDIKSLTEMLKDEEKTIENLIQKKSFVVKEYDKKQKTLEKGIFYHFPNGLYMEVLDKGGERPTPEKTRVIVRMRGEMLLMKELVGTFDSLSSGGFQDAEFKYVNRYERGEVHFIPMTVAPGYSLSNLLCEGLAYPMTLLGDGARVRLIIPFSIGPSINYREGKTMFCDEVRYEFSRF